jgi:hypothetical protein
MKDKEWKTTPWKVLHIRHHEPMLVKQGKYTGIKGTLITAKTEGDNTRLQIIAEDGKRIFVNYDDVTLLDPQHEIHDMFDEEKQPEGEVETTYDAILFMPENKHAAYKAYVKGIEEGEYYS